MSASMTALGRGASAPVAGLGVPWLTAALEGAHAIGRDDEDLSCPGARIGRAHVSAGHLVDECQPLVIVNVGDPTADREATPGIGGIDERYGDLRPAPEARLLYDCLGELVRMCSPS